MRFGIRVQPKNGLFVSVDVGNGGGLGAIAMLADRNYISVVSRWYPRTPSAFILILPPGATRRCRCVSVVLLKR